MSTIGTIENGHFDGHQNVTKGQRRFGDAVLEEFLEQIKVDILALEAYMAGLQDPKDSVRCATAAALNACTASGTGVGKKLTQNAAAIEACDGIAAVLGNRWLVQDQVAAKDNGIYTVTTVGTGVIPQVLTRATDADTDAEMTSGVNCHVEEGTVNADTHFYLTTNDPITLDTTALVFAELVAVEHAATHILSGADEIDGDLLDIDFTPTSYAPTVTAPATDADHLTAHLSGIDLELADVVQDEGCAASVQLIFAGQPVATDTLTIGADVYEFDGVGANINVTIGGTAELTMDALVIEINTNGSELLLADKLSATRMRIRTAAAVGGAVVGADPSIVLDASAQTNGSFDAGDVNMNTLAGRAAAKRASCTVEFPITTAMITGTPYRVAFPFTPVAIEPTMRTAAGAIKIASLDTFTIVGDDVSIGFGGAGTDLANTDILTLRAIA